MFRDDSSVLWKHCQSKLADGKVAKSVVLFPDKKIWQENGAIVCECSNGFCYRQRNIGPLVQVPELRSVMCMMCPSFCPL